MAPSSSSTQDRQTASVSQQAMVQKPAARIAPTRTDSNSENKPDCVLHHHQQQKPTGQSRVLRESQSENAPKATSSTRQNKET